MKKITKISLAFIAALFLNAGIQSENKIEGTWRNTGNQLFQIQIFSTAKGRYDGKIINHKKDTSLNGRIILHQLHYQADKKIFSGRMSAPDRDTKLAAELTLQTPDMIRINARKSVFSKTLYLARVK